MMTTTEKYINKAVSKAKEELGGNHLSNIHLEMNMQADGATQILAEALMEQAKANAANSEAMARLASALKPTDVCAFKITGDGVELGG